MNKQYRNPIGRRMEDAIMCMADNMLLANFSDYENKVKYLTDTMVCYERLQFAINIGIKVKCISYKQQAQVSLILSQIGKQITGLRKYAEEHKGHNYLSFSVRNLYVSYVLMSKTTTFCLISKPQAMIQPIRKTN